MTTHPLPFLFPFSLSLTCSRSLSPSPSLTHAPVHETAHGPKLTRLEPQFLSTSRAAHTPPISAHHLHLYITIPVPYDVNSGRSNHCLTQHTALFNMTYSLPNSIIIDWDPLRRQLRSERHFRSGYHQGLRVVPNNLSLRNF